MEMETNLDERIARLVPKDRAFLMPKQLVEIIHRFMDDGKIGDDGRFTSRFAAFEFKIILNNFRNQIASINLHNFEDTPNIHRSPEVSEWQTGSDAPVKIQHVLDNPNTVFSIPRKAGLNSMIQKRKIEIERCKNDFGYFCEKYLKIRINDSVKPLFDVVDRKLYENQTEKHS